MASPLKILVDQDEILCQWSNRVLELWNRNHPALYVESVNTWDTNGFLGHPEATYFARSLMLKPEFWAELEPVPGAVEGMKRLIDAGHQVRIVTQILPYAGVSFEGKLQWIRRNLPFFNLDHFVATKLKSEVKGDVLFDDAPHQLEAFQKVGIAVAMRYPWNELVQCPKVKNWTEFLKLVRDLG